MFEFEFLKEAGLFGLVALVMVYFLRSLPQIKDTVDDLEEKVDKMLELIRHEHDCENTDAS